MTVNTSGRTPLPIGTTDSTQYTSVAANCLLLDTNGNPTPLPALVDGRLPVDVASLSVSLGSSNLIVANTTSQPVPVTTTSPISVSNFPVTQSISGTVEIASLPASSTILGKVGIDQTTPGTTNLVQLPASQISTLTPLSSVGVSSLPSLPAGSNLIGQVSINNNVSIIAISGIVSGSGDNTLISATTGHSIIITAITLQFESGTGPITALLHNYLTGSPPSTTVTKRFLFNTVSDAVVYQYSPGFQLSLGTSNPLVLNLSTSAQIGYSIEYYIL